ncbi:23S ribosomal RNA methyltransferase Erm [Streptomyces sp. NPDC052020]|uniref:23S ribosomal RNA methyltransferase Erm n=1 Tax=Streptomyces sp. NPDC052020 TaxID=3155677 RepID=UPI00342B7656
MTGRGPYSPRTTRDDLRRELGQNFLQDKRVVRDLVSCVAGTGTNVLEIGPGKGAITSELIHSFETVTAVEMDPHWASYLREKFDGRRVRIFQGDFLDFRIPGDIDTVVGNVPFGITTQILRRLLESTQWQSAALIVQWEVARKRVGRSGGTLLSTSWAPWYEFDLRGRVRATAFRPMPRVDGGILTIRRRPQPLLPERACAAFQDFAEAVFTGPGRGLAEILRRHVPRRTYMDLAERFHIPADGLPKDLTLRQWVVLFEAARPQYADGGIRTASQQAQRAAGRRGGPSHGDGSGPRAPVRQTQDRQGGRRSSSGRRTGKR